MRKFVCAFDEQQIKYWICADGVAQRSEVGRERDRDRERAREIKRAGGGGAREGRQRHGGKERERVKGQLTGTRQQAEKAMEGIGAFHHMANQSDTGPQLSSRVAEPHSSASIKKLTQTPK